MKAKGTLGFMLQGVSQQPERVQPEGHVFESINRLPDVNLGNTSRPGTQHVALYGDIAGGSSITTVNLDGRLFNVIVSPAGEVKVRDEFGTAWGVIDGAAFPSYHSGDMFAYSLQGKIYILNRNRIVTGSVAAYSGLTAWGYAYSLGGNFSREYTLRIEYADNTVAVGTYEVPDGTTAGDAEKASASYIINQLKIALEAHANFKPSTTITRKREYLSILDSATTFDVLAEDGDDNQLLRAGVSKARTFADVPKFAPEGAVILVTGEIGSTLDDVWLRFDVAGVSTVGNGFGAAGVWRETVKPADNWMPDKSTMPHILTPDYTNVLFTLTRGDWEGRRVGDAKTAPLPSFVGKRISDMGEFAQRLWFISGSAWVASRTKIPNDFFRETAQQELATDPIDISASGEEDSKLLYGTAYDRSLVICSETAQFFVEGGLAITPQNAAIPRTTKFEMSVKARPVLSGDLLMFPYKNRRFSGINEMRPSSNILDNYIENISKVAPRYIDGEVVQLASSGNSRFVVVRTDGTARTLWVYNFLWDNQQKLQSAWHKWTFRENIIHVYVAAGEVHILTRNGTSVRHSKASMDKPDELNLPYHATLDFKREIAVDGSHTYRLDRDDYVFFTSVDGGDYLQGRKVTPIAKIQAVGDHTDYVFAEGHPTFMLTGVPVNTEIVPIKPIFKDWRGNVQPGMTTIPNKFVVDYVDSGPFDAYVQGQYIPDGEAFVLSNEVVPLEDTPQDDFGTTIFSGSFDIPWGYDANTARLILRTKTVQPVTYSEVRWHGQVYDGLK